MTKTFFVAIFAQREFFLKTLAKYNYGGTPAFTCQSRVEYYSINISMQKSFNQSAQFIKSFMRYTWFKSPMIYKASLIFYHAYPIIIKVTFSFPKFISACQKSVQFIYLLLRYNKFQKLKTYKTTPIFDHHHPKIIKVTFGFPEFLSTHQKSVNSINSFLKYS